MGILHRVDDMTGQNGTPAPIPSITTESKTKLERLSDECNEAIYAGTNVTLKDGISYPFTYNLHDQANISEMFNACLAGATGYIYHANDGSCRTYSAEDIITIYYTLSLYKTGQTTYFNQLKQYALTLSDEEVETIFYGQPLTGIYLETYNTLMQYAKNQLDSIIAKLAARSQESYYASYNI